MLPKNQAVPWPIEKLNGRTKSVRCKQLHIVDCLSDTSFFPPGCHGERSRPNRNSEAEENRDDTNAMAKPLLHNLEKLHCARDSETAWVVSLARIVSSCQRGLVVTTGRPRYA